jgi:hypothetical protein
MIAWAVYLGKKHIDTVYYMANMSASEVKRGLVNHDGYDARIQVHKAK